MGRKARSGKHKEARCGGKRKEETKKEQRYLRKAVEHQPKTKCNVDEKTVNEATIPSAEIAYTAKDTRNKTKRRHPQTEAMKMPNVPKYSEVKVKELLQKFKAKTIANLNNKIESLEPSTEMKRLINLPKMYGSADDQARVIEQVRQSTEELIEHNKQLRTELSKDIESKIKKYDISIRNSKILAIIAEEWKLLEANLVYPANNDIDKLIIPSYEELQKITIRMSSLRSKRINKMNIAFLRKNTVERNYAQLLRSYKSHKDLIHCILSRRQRKENTMGNQRMLLAHVKLLEDILSKLSREGESIFSSKDNKFNWKKKLQRHEHICKRMRENSVLLNDCTSKKKAEAVEMNRILEEKKKELLEMEEELGNVCKDFEQRTIESNQYSVATETCKRFQMEIKDVEKVNKHDEVILKDLQKQLDDIREKPRRYVSLIEEFVEMKEKIEEQKMCWIDKEKAQESLKEILRMKTGIILKEEENQARLSETLEEIRNEKKAVEEQITILKYMKQKLIVKQREYNKEEDEQKNNINQMITV